MHRTTESNEKPAVYIIEMYWEPTIPECGVWDRSTDYPNLYTEEEANKILASRLAYRKVQVN